MFKQSAILLATPFLALFSALACAQQPLVQSPLPLGRAGLPQTVKRELLAPGVQHYRIHRGTPDKSGGWLLISGVITTDEQRAAARKCFEGIGLRPFSTTFHLDGAEAQRYDILSAGRFPTRAAAQAEAARAKLNACAVFARHSAEDAANDDGPWEIEVVALEPSSSAALAVLTGEKGPQLRRQVSSLAKAAGALAAVNGGFFAMAAEDGFPGQPTGISIIDGQINSSPVAARPALLIRQGDKPAASIVRNVDLRTALIAKDGARIAIDGVNRKPGLIRDCGRDASDKPVHDHTCRYGDDIVYFPAGSSFGAVTGKLGIPLVRFAVGSNGVLRRLEADAGPSAGEAVLALTVGSARLPELERLAAEGVAVAFKADSNLGVDLDADTQVVNGGPTLLMGGKALRDEVDEGWGIKVNGDPQHNLLMHDWVNRREPRTAVGVQPDGTVLLLTVDGHRHNASVGMTIEELRLVFKALGARDAINLDGGGSTALAVGGRLVTQPSDLAGERPVGDVIAILPGAKAAK